MIVKLITPPSDMPVSLEEARNAARINGTDHDSELTNIVNALTAEAEHYIGKAIINRTYSVYLDSFPGRIELPYLPVGEVTEVTYYDAEGMEQTLSPELWLLDESYLEPSVVPAYGTSWPETATRHSAVKITYVAGYGGSSSSVPAAFKGYILAKVKEYFAPPGTPEYPNLIGMLYSLKAHV